MISVDNHICKSIEEREIAIGKCVLNSPRQLGSTPTDKRRCSTEPVHNLVRVNKIRIYKTNPRHLNH